jgi:hypothetical protein
MPRRFPPPWSVEELGACFVARDQWLLPPPLAGCSSKTGPSLPLDGRCFGKGTFVAMGVGLVGLPATDAWVFEQLPFP